MDFMTELILVPNDVVTLSVSEEHTEKRSYRDAIAEATSAKVLIDRPRWKSLGDSPLRSNRSPALGQILLVRLQYQFHTMVPETVFESAEVKVQLTPTAPDVSVSVYDLFPRDERTGRPREVTVEMSPSISIATAKFAMGKVSTEIEYGTVVPSVVGFTGEDEVSPRWELKSTSTSPLRGLRTFWLMIEVDGGHRSIDLSTQVTGTVKTNWGVFDIRHTKETWCKLDTIVG